MDTLSKVNIISGNTYTTLKYELPLFRDFKDINFKNPKSFLQIKEYNNLIINFENENINSKLFFKSFDILDDSKINVENDEYYINPGNIDVINMSNNEIDNNLVPGYYHIIVKSKEIFHGIIEIIPKDLNEKEWIKMYEEIEEYSRGLAFSLSQKSNNKLLKVKQDESDLINILSYINENYRYLKNALNYIRTNPRYSLDKRYKWINKNFAPLVDGNTIKQKLKYPEKDDYLYSPKRVVNYNISENRWIKKALTSINKHLNTLREQVDEKNKFLIEQLTNTNKNYRNEIDTINKSRENLVESKRKINHIINELSKFSLEDWYKEVIPSDTFTPPLNAVMNQNYKIILQWYQSIFKEKMSLVYGEVLQNSWKRTDELYEIWSYINVIEEFKNLNFEVISGWVYDNPLNELVDGTMVTLEKDVTRVCLHYNSFLANDSAHATKVNPLYTTSSKNKPDIRIDFFMKEIYITSIIVDSKYRKFKSIININYGSTSQLHAYYDSPKSNRHLLNAPEHRRESHRIIYRVIVLYPPDKSSGGNARAKERLKDHKITFVEYSPDNKDDSLSESFEKTLSFVEATYKDLFSQFLIEN